MTVQLSGRVHTVALLPQKVLSIGTFPINDGNDGSEEDHLDTSESAPILSA